MDIYSIQAAISEFQKNTCNSFGLGEASGALRGVALRSTIERLSCTPIHGA